MTPKARVLAACAFRAPDRIPRFDSFWNFPAEWERRFGPRSGLSDIVIRVPKEGAFPTRARSLGTKNGWDYGVDSWGRTIRRKPGVYFTETLEVPIPGQTPLV